MIEFECSCAMGKHRAPLEGYEISSGALNKIPEILKDYNKIYVVADENTYRAAGNPCFRNVARRPDELISEFFSYLIPSFHFTSGDGNTSYGCHKRCFLFIGRP